jgi:hypothetical protein
MVVSTKDVIVDPLGQILVKLDRLVVIGSSKVVALHSIPISPRIGIHRRLSSTILGGRV